MNRKVRFRTAIFAAWAAVASWPVLAADQLVVHEWGTFTVLQDADGQEITGVNVDDEPVPAFVHTIGRDLLSPRLLSNEYWRYRMKGVPRRHYQVTMRLETPVIYFYPPMSQSEPLPLDVEVSFRGGWLSEFYPNAEYSAPGLKRGNFEFTGLTPDTVGSLAWRNLQVGTDGKIPKTDEQVWLAPRQVAAATVTNGAENPQSEKYLFYRGVGQLHAPLRVKTDLKSNRLSLYANFQDVLDEGETETIQRLWLADIRADGEAAFRELEALSVNGNRSAKLRDLPAGFEAEDYRRDGLTELRSAMHQQLVEAGLFDDEATAMLATWERAYFKSPGLRLFFVVPRTWTDHYLPLSISREAEVERVMMGRIELITPQQRELLTELADAEVSNAKWISQLQPQELKRQMYAGRFPEDQFDKVREQMPTDYQLYMQLGRFRNALVIAEEKQRPSPALTKFINTYGLQPYRDKSSIAKRETTGQK